MSAARTLAVVASGCLVACGCRDGAALAPATGTAGPAAPAAPLPGDRVAAPLHGTATASAGDARVVGKGSLGVPLHSKPGTSAVSGRLPSGTSIRIEERREDGRWLLVVASDGTRGWITKRYIDEALAAVDAGAAEASPWSSPAACEAVLAARSSARPAGKARIATWNVRWFPDGGPGKSAGERPTDIAWLGCAIAWLDVDVVALQEIKAYPGAREKLDLLARDLDRRTSGAWRSSLDDCQPEAAQHVGLLWASKRVKVQEARKIAAFNPNGGACEKGLRPGYAARLSFSGGLDLSLVSLHLKSGDDERAHQLRRKSFAAIRTAWPELAGSDGDVLLAGDWNTMGCRECEPRVSGKDELAELDRTLAALTPALVRLPADATCSETSGSHRELLDHFVAPRAMAELAPDARADVTGYCEVTACSTRGEPPAAHEHLSDHCPVVIELDDRDAD